MAKENKGLLQAIKEQDKKINNAIDNGKTFKGVDAEELREAFKNKLDAISNNKVVTK